MSETMDRNDTVQDELAAMRAELAELRARLDAKEAAAAPAPSTTGGDLPDLNAVTTDRRALLRRGGAAAAAAMAGGAVVAISQASPAAAANGNSIIIGNFGGSANTGTANTELRVTGTGFGAWHAFSVQDGTQTLDIFGKAAIGGFANGASQLDHGVYGYANGTAGVFGRGGATAYGGLFQGGKADIKFATIGNAPTTSGSAHSAGEVDCDSAGNLWYCGVDGTPGAWRKLGGPGTAGQLHVLNAPVRVFDSRAGFAPLNSAKGIFNNQTKVIDAKNNSSGVPAGCQAVLVNFAVTNTSSGGYGTLFAADVADPGTASVNWGGMSGLTLNNSVVTAVDNLAQFKCHIATTADVIIDVVGYWM